MTTKRIEKERAYLHRDPIEGCTAEPVSDTDLLYWTGAISGAPGTPYQHGTFTIAVDFPEDYPTQPLRLTFTTPLFHPNVDSSGGVALADLQRNNWSPAVTIRHILLSLQAMLSDPNLEEGCVLNAEAGALLRDDRAEFDRQVRREVASQSA